MAPSSERYAAELRRLEPLGCGSLVHAEPDGSLRVTPLGRLLVQPVAAAFDAHLGEQREDGQRRFSQSI